MENKLPDYLRSSLDHTKLSKTAKGLVLVVSGLIVFMLSHYSINISQNQVFLFMDQIMSTISAMGVAVGVIITVYGIMIKILVNSSVKKG